MESLNLTTASEFENDTILSDMKPKKSKNYEEILLKGLGSHIQYRKLQMIFLILHTRIC